jgi:hypothetical protein
MSWWHVNSDDERFFDFLGGLVVWPIGFFADLAEEVSRDFKAGLEIRRENRAIKRKSQVARIEAKAKRAAERKEKIREAITEKKDRFLEDARLAKKLGLELLNDYIVDWHMDNDVNRKGVEVREKVEQTIEQSKEKAVAWFTREPEPVVKMEQPAAPVISLDERRAAKQQRQEQSLER